MMAILSQTHDKDHLRETSYRSTYQESFRDDKSICDESVHPVDNNAAFKTHNSGNADPIPEECEDQQVMTEDLRMKHRSLNTLEEAPEEAENNEDTHEVVCEAAQRMIDNSTEFDSINLATD